MDSSASTPFRASRTVAKGIKFDVMKRCRRRLLHGIVVLNRKELATEPRFARDLVLEADRKKLRMLISEIGRWNQESVLFRLKVRKPSKVFLISTLDAVIVS